MPVGVDPGRGQHVHVDHPAPLADLHRQPVRRHERVRAGVQRPAAEVGDLLVQLAGHHADLRLRQPGDAQRLDQLLHPPRRHAEQVTGRDHADQGPLGPFAAFQQPIGKVGALPQLRDRHLHGAGAGVELPGPVTVAGIGPISGARTVRGAAQSVGFGAHQRLHERVQHRTQQVRLGTLQMLSHERGQVNTVGIGGHRVDLLQVDFERSSEGSRDGRLLRPHDTQVGEDSYTTSLDLSQIWCGVGAEGSVGWTLGTSRTDPMFGRSRWAASSAACSRAWKPLTGMAGSVATVASKLSR